MDNALQEYKAIDILCIVDEEGELGSGSFGTVLFGKHPVLGNVALKCFSVPGGSRKKDYLERKIKKEYHMLQRANHDHIARVYGWSKWPNSMALVMQYMPGGNLSNLLLESQCDLGPFVRLRLCSETSDGIAFIHNLNPTKQLVHGDLKPENILLTDDLHIKVSDFGSAELRATTGSSTATSTSRNACPEFTLIYAAPERLENLNTKLKKEHDTYSFSLIMHMVLTREELVRFDVDTFLEAVKRGQRPDVEDIMDYKDKLDDEQHKHIVEQLVAEMQKCWQQLPADRPEMLHVRDRLQGLLSKGGGSAVLGEVQTALEEFTVSLPSTSGPLSALSAFSTANQSFVQDASASEGPLKVKAEPILATIRTDDDDTSSDTSSDDSDQGNATPKNPAGPSSSGSNLSFPSFGGGSGFSGTISVQAGTMINSPVAASDVYYGDAALIQTTKAKSRKQKKN